MPIRQTFSEREQLASDPPALQQDTISETCRVQVMAALISGIHRPEQAEPSMYPPLANSWWANISHRATIGLGRLQLHGGVPDPMTACVELVRTGPRREALTVIECALEIVDTELRTLNGMQRDYYNYTVSADEIIAQVNERFQQHGVGYE